jgi:hypothetical protein
MYNIFLVIYKIVYASFIVPLTAFVASRFVKDIWNDPSVTLLTRANGIPLPVYWMMSPNTIDSGLTKEFETVNTELPLVAIDPLETVETNPAAELIVTPDVMLVP